MSKRSGWFLGPVRYVVLVGLLAAVAAGKALGEDAAKASAPTKGAVLRSGNWSMQLPLGLDPEMANIPEDNPMSEEKVALGKLLYFDPRLSRDNTVSCATCHIPFHGFAEPRRTSLGVDRKEGTRNAPTVINRLFSADQFWDGRAASLEEQAKGPLVNPVEMAMPSLEAVAEKVRAIKGYRPLFRKAFGDDRIDIDRIVKAIAAYERTVVSGDSPFDRYMAGDKSAMSESAVRGFAIFAGKGKCVTCHVGPNFTDENYRNLGVGIDGPKPDLGRYEVTKKEEDRGAFKTPTLRNVALTAPYMHDGSENTLMDVIEFYNRGGNKNPNLSAGVEPLNLTEQEKVDLRNFLLALTGPVTNADPPERLPE